LAQGDHLGEDGAAVVQGERVGAWVVGGRVKKQRVVGVYFVRKSVLRIVKMLAIFPAVS
jgi:hypothetical protein